MKKFSKRWFGNFLIVLFGVAILTVVGLLSYQLWFTSADSANKNLPYYSINGDYLYIYYPNAIRDAFFSNQTQAADPFAKISYYNDPQLGRTQMAFLPVKNVSYASGWETSEDPSFKLLTFAYGKAQDSLDKTSLPILNTAIYNYRQAIIYSGTNYRIAADTLYVHEGFATPYESFRAANSTGDEDVTISHSFPNSHLAAADSWSLAIPIKSDTKYKNPRAGSLAETIINSALSSATSAEAKENALLHESAAPSNLDKTFFSQDKGMIKVALDNYKKQIASNTSANGLSISSVDSVDFSGSVTISFSADMRQIVSGSRTPEKFSITINNSFVTSFDPSVDSNNPGRLTWSASQKKGTFILDANTGDPAKKVSTNFPGAKVFELSAFDQNNQVLAKADKTINVGYDNSNSTTTGGSLNISVSAPNTVNTADPKSKNTSITISSSSLNGNVAFLSWWICSRSRSELLQPTDDSHGCSPRSPNIDVTGQQSVPTDLQTVTWDASGTPANSARTIMVKAFAPNDANGNNPYIEGSKTFSNEINVINDPTAVSETPTGDGVTGSISQDWAANFKKSTITSIDALIKTIGPFTLLLLGILAVLAIVIAGLKYITSGGDPKGAESGKKAILFTIFGIAIAILSVDLISITITEVRKIIGDALPGPNAAGSILPTGLGGPNASVLDIIGHDNGFIWEIIKLAVYYAEAIAFFYILYASFLYITSFGDDAKAESGKKTLIWAVIGLAVVISANFILVKFAGIIAP